MRFSPDYSLNHQDVREKQHPKGNLGNPEAIGTLTEAAQTPENRQIGIVGGAVRLYHGAVEPGTVPGQGSHGKSSQE